MGVMDSAAEVVVLAVAVLLLLETALNVEGLLETIEVTRAKAAQKTTRGSSRGIGHGATIAASCLRSLQLRKPKDLVTGRRPDQKSGEAVGSKQL